VNQNVHVAAVPWAREDHVRRRAGKGLPGRPKKESGLSCLSICFSTISIFRDEFLFWERLLIGFLTEYLYIFIVLTLN
jgi:hypothetical protein